MHRDIFLKSFIYLGKSEVNPGKSKSNSLLTFQCIAIKGMKIVAHFNDLSEFEKSF